MSVKKRSDAVSAVVGVMLMLTLVIIFAAVLSAFVSGVIQSPDQIPDAEIFVQSSGKVSDETFSLLFEHRGGEMLSVANCKITTFVNGKEGSFTASEVSNDEITWKAGVTLSTKNLSATEKYMNLNSGELETLIKSSTPVELRIYYIPTNSILMKSTILLEEK